MEFDRVVPPAGNLQLAGRQLWLGPARSGQVVRFWADTDLIHLFIGGTRIKTVRSHLTVTDLARLVAAGAVAAGPSPLPPIEPGDAVEVERVVSRGGTVVLGGHVVLAAEILSGRRLGIRIERDTLMFFDLDSRELLRPTDHDRWHPEWAKPNIFRGRPKLLCSDLAIPSVIATFSTGTGAT